MATPETKLSPPLRPWLAEVVDEVQGLLKTTGTQTSALSDAVGARCPPQCGRCCLNPVVETTVAEMLPWAVRVCAAGHADAWLMKFAALPEGMPCALFVGGATYGSGRCGIYEDRPGICRLFATAYRRDKNQQRDFVACHEQLKNNPDLLPRAAAYAQGSAEVPEYQTYSLTLGGIAGELGKRRYPINQAAREALELVLFQQQYQKCNS